MEMPDWNIFIRDLDELNIVLTDAQLSQFMEYYELLSEWNKIMNLTSITDFEDVLKKHFIDSLSIVKVYNDFSKETVIDVGTGAGFPAIPLKIVFPGLKITLLDSVNKKINFLETVISELKLENVTAVHGRAEDFSRNEMFRENFDLCLSRAVANLSTLSEYCLPYVKPGGKFISYKSGAVSEEASAAGKAVSVLGGRIENKEEFIIPNSDIKRMFIVIEKIKRTPFKYPRKAGVPAKSPIK